MAAADAVFPASRNPMFMPNLVREGLEPHRVRRLYLSGSNEPGVRVDVSAHLERKMEALLRHTSQFVADADSMANVRARAAAEGRHIGVAAAEAFRLVVIDPD
jgi:LmbE family N-acetylglucosaminyl deacetylase